MMSGMLIWFLFCIVGLLLSFELSYPSGNLLSLYNWHIVELHSLLEVDVLGYLLLDVISTNKCLPKIDETLELLCSVYVISHYSTGSV